MASSTHEENDYMTKLDEGLKFYETLMKLLYTFSVSIKDTDNRNFFSAAHKKFTNAYRDLCSIILWIELEQKEESPEDVYDVINSCILSIERDALEINTVYSLAIKKDHDHWCLVNDKTAKEQHKNTYGEDDSLYYSQSVNVDASCIDTLLNQDSVHIREMKKHQQAVKNHLKTKQERLRVEQDRLEASREAQIRKLDQESQFLIKYYIKAVQIASQDLLDIFHHRALLHK